MMQRLEWTHMDKTEWPDGPWKSEPDKLQWLDEATGLPCLIKRNHIGSLCGYVGVTSDHPYYQQDYDSTNLDAHDGLTFAGGCQDSSKFSQAMTICHVPDEREPDDIWWFGFDCAHAGDLIPGMPTLAFEPLASRNEVYRDLSYVQNECASLARQLKAAADSVLVVESL